MTVIVPNLMHKDGKIVSTECADYFLDDGIRGVQLKAKQYPHHVLTGVKARLPVVGVWKCSNPTLSYSMAWSVILSMMPSTIKRRTIRSA